MLAWDDHLPVCPRCGDLLALNTLYCPECGVCVVVDRSVETVDRPNGLRSDQGGALDRPEAQGIASTPVEQRS